MSRDASAATPMPSAAHDGSTSSSNTSTPSALALQPGPTLWLEMWENQRWYPVIGWGPSRFQGDLPTFCLVPPAYRHCGAHPAAFDAALEAANPVEPDTPEPQWAARRILKVALPPGYRWVGFWEVHKEHPRGTDSAGWRYGEQFWKSTSDADDDAGEDTADRPAAPSRLAPFKKTHTPLCVVRRRLWRRRVAVLTAEDTTPPPENVFLGDAEQQLEAYLTEKQEEMDVAEDLKRQERMALAAGEPWSQEQEIIAEDELRRFCRERQSRESATRMRSTNPSFVNPFRLQGEEGFRLSPASDPIDARGASASGGRETQLSSGAVAASTWARAGQTNGDSFVVVSPIEGLEEPHETNPLDGLRRADVSNTDAVTFKASFPTSPSRVDGGDAADQNTVSHFVAATPTESASLHVDGAEMARDNTVEEFVVATPTEAADRVSYEPSTSLSVGMMSNPTGSEFRAIFSQFMAPSAEAETK